MLLKGALLLSALAGVLASPVAQRNNDDSNSIAWSAAIEKARSIVAQMTFDEKINFSEFRTQGIVCSGQTHAISRFDIPSICFSDGPTGINSRFSSQFPAQVTVAATFDRDLMYERAKTMGKEFRDVGIHTPLSLVVGPMGRSVLGGRNFENFSPDPFLSGEAIRESIAGIQSQGVTGLVKHWFGNEQELARIGSNVGGYFPSNQTQTISSNIDDATAHELYIYPFAEAVRAGAGAIMASYNKLNGTLASEDPYSLKTLLKEELGFKGFILSDWGSAHNTVESALAGLDFVEAGSGPSIWGDNLRAPIQNGTLPSDILDDKIVRVLTPYFALNQDKLPEVNFSRIVTNKKHNEVIRKISTSSITLLKNNRTSSPTVGLPIANPRSILLVGSAAGEGRYGIISNQAASIFFYTPDAPYVGAITNGFGSGGSPAPYVVTPLQGIQERAREMDDFTFVDGYYSDNATEGAGSLPGGLSTVYLDGRLAYPEEKKVLVFVTAVAMEGYDRENLDLINGGNELIEYVAARHSDVVVCISAPGPVNMPFISHPNISSVVFSHLPGQEAGHALADVLFGDVNPSGKLPFTIAKEFEDYDLAAYYNGSVKAFPETAFSEGVFIDYKYFDQQNTTPLYEFGYGMSYTTFNMSKLSIKSTSKAGRAAVSETNEKFFKDGKNETCKGLYDISHTVTAVVKNTGKVAGAEVAQLYLTYPEATPNKMPVCNLRGFEKPFLQPGESKTVTFELRNKDLSVWDVTKQGWMLPKGEFKVSVGTSSRKLPLKGSFSA
ncbi:beta-glucosidase [Sporobolomyces salmoneus]|uniref:beta-glucosidase n=1 Tax=Sporobolomyces salmoneus TaxID=183962 RepID=UPI0031825C47